MRASAFFLFLLGEIFLAGCGGSSNPCIVTANVMPATATADHAAAAPGNQVQFMRTSTSKGNCLPQPDPVGTWSTSDPVNTSLSLITVNTVTVTCVNATPSPATISNSGTVNGQSFTPATLTCR
jgi:hypothetical protein